MFASIVAEVNKHLESGEISRADAQRVLDPSDFELLEGVVVPSHLYPLVAFARLNELAFETVGGGRVEYLQELGAGSAVRLLDTKVYAQLNHARRTEVVEQGDPYERFEAFGRDLELITRVFSCLANFGKTTCEPDPDHGLRWMITDEMPIEFTDLLVWRMIGFRNEVARTHGHRDLWTWERISPTVFRSRMTCDA